LNPEDPWGRQADRFANRLRTADRVRVADQAAVVAIVSVFVEQIPGVCNN
jgi:hypothetical protein